CSNLGPNIVILTVTDDNGNTATCTAIITVIDNIPPTIACPAPLTVECQNVSNPDNTSQFGNATGNDNCPPPLITETHVLNLSACNVGTILRTFTATDGSGNTATCTQLVTIINVNPLDAGDITWPTSPLSVNICNSTEPPATGVPVINPQALACANVVVSHTDVMQVFIDNNPNTPCKVIMRTWVVTDLCQQNATFTFVQTINVQDMVPPAFTNINDMTKVANADCVAFFTLIANATDCAGVTITNNSPYGATSGANASGNYPIGVTTVIFTATDGCGNISTMDVVITVTDPNPAEFQCLKIIVILPEETEVTVAAHEFVIVFPGGCSNEDDFIFSYSNTDPFDTLHLYDCSDVGVQTFPLYFWNAAGTMIVDSCATADLELRDPNDWCMDGLVVSGEVKNEVGFPISNVQVSITNAPMIPDTTDAKGGYRIEGLNENASYFVAPFNDRKPKEGVSTLDLVLIQKHLLGIAKLNSPYKLIAADANRSGVVTALDLLEIRKLILGITSKFQNNTSWRFVDDFYEFPDPFNPFSPGFPESVWIDSIVQEVYTVDFTGIKVGDVNGSYFSSILNDGKIESRSGQVLELNTVVTKDQNDQLDKWEIRASSNQDKVDGFQFSLVAGPLDADQLKEICSDVIPADQWYYDPNKMTLNVSWSPTEQQDLTGKLILCGPMNDGVKDLLGLDNSLIPGEAYHFEGEDVQILPLKLNGLPVEKEEDQEYHLFQNIPNPFHEGTIVRFTLPRDERVQLIVHDMTGRKVLDKQVEGSAGINEIEILSQDLGVQGVYYYTLQTLSVSLTRKMSFTTY
ncbi:MAG TPA: T9SS type A sorting domain-containing protein, partial [Saprospiraceae bacterium]|nr:T9SS type A sorting domain-containing protein [Saprospiraceae bacterium]